MLYPVRIARPFYVAATEVTRGQWQAIGELIEGKKRVEIEASVGVSHAQLHRWTHENPEFIRQWRSERARTHERRMDKFFAKVDDAHRDGLVIRGELLAEGGAERVVDRVHRHQDHRELGAPDELEKVCGVEPNGFRHWRSTR